MTYAAVEDHLRYYMAGNSWAAFGAMPPRLAAIFANEAKRDHRIDLYFATRWVPAALAS